MATPSARRWSYSEFARLPDDGNRYEVIGGELYVTPAPGTRHQLLVTRLGHILSGFVEEHRLGWVIVSPVDVLFAEGDYVEPDLVFVRRERKGIISDRGIEAAPDLVVEVLSESTSKTDRGVKRERYTHFGVPQYWIVDPEERTVEIYQLTQDPVRSSVARETMTAHLIPGGPALTIDLAELFKGFD
ncbi:MAG: Uma2 family endonuclease [Betaproteobacteria bacterium]|nr:Uma2 family endonuclease [Betaproteobacteria bacterium]